MGIMFTKGPPTSHNYFKITLPKKLLKIFSTFNLHHGPIRVKVKEGSYVDMLKGMASQLAKITTSN
jgi:hypothetical protein